MEITKTEYQDWKMSNVTREMEREAQETVIDMTLQIINRRESNPLDDQYLKGFLQGVQAIMDWRPEFIEEEQTNA